MAATAGIRPRRTYEDRDRPGAHRQRGAALANQWLAYRDPARKQGLEELEKQNQEYLNSTIENTIAPVMTQYYDVVRQQSYMRTLDTSIAVEKKQLNIVQTQLSVGLANNADLFQTQLDLNSLLQQKQSQNRTIGYCIYVAYLNRSRF